jgi:hypothetical protein
MLHMAVLRVTTRETSLSMVMGLERGNGTQYHHTKQANADKTPTGM